MSSRTTATANTRLHDLCQRFGTNAAVLYPDVPATPTRVTWREVRRHSNQDSFARRVIQHLKRFTDNMNHLLNSSANLNQSVESEQNLLIVLERCEDVNLDHFLSPATLGRLRGQLGSACWKVATMQITISEEEHERTRSQVNFLASTMKTLLAALEASEVMGSSFGEKVVMELHIWMDSNPFSTDQLGSSGQNDNYSIMEAVQHLQNDKDLGGNNATSSIARSTSHVSDRLTQLMNELSPRVNVSDSRILVLVHTREVARQLTKFLQKDNVINAAFHPRVLVGHGGYDGMS
eukprot:1932258-Ditylum_brightwellii.AAC.1